MKTLADLKRKLQIGMRLTMIYNSVRIKKLPLKREVINVQSNGIHFIDPTKDRSTQKRGSFLDFPKASLLEINEKGFKIFESGRRDLTKEEKGVIANEPRDAKQDEIDIMSDGSTMYWRRKRYYIEKGFEYLFNGDKNKRIDSNDRTKVIDSNVKGELSLEYIFD
jgi:hypothetical protein